MNLLESTDAMVWAEEFVRIKKEMNWTLDDIDEGLMLGWFANAMMAMHDNLLKGEGEMTSLSGEIYSQFYSSCFDEGGYNEFTQDDAQKMVNKVLDATAEAIWIEMAKNGYPVNSRTVVQVAIDKLRGEK